jgi:hypothetical protein
MLQYMNHSCGIVQHQNWFSVLKHCQFFFTIDTIHQFHSQPFKIILLNFLQTQHKVLLCQQIRLPRLCPNFLQTQHKVLLFQQITLCRLGSSVGEIIAINSPSISRQNPFYQFAAVTVSYSELLGQGVDLHGHYWGRFRVYFWIECWI